MFFDLYTKGEITMYDKITRRNWISFTMSEEEFQAMIRKMTVTQSKADFIRKAIKAYKPNNKKVKR